MRKLCLAVFCGLLASCTALKPEATAVSLGAFSTRMSQELQYFYFLNAQSAQAPIGVCLRSLDMRLNTTQSDQTINTLELELEPSPDETMVVTPRLNRTQSEVQTYRLVMVPQYQNPARYDQEAMAELAATMDPADFPFAQALMQVKRSLAGAQQEFGDPRFGPELKPQRLVATFQLKVSSVKSGRLVLEVLTTRLLGEAVFNGYNAQTDSSDAIAIASFIAPRPAAKGGCGPVKPNQPARPKGEVF